MPVATSKEIAGFMQEAQNEALLFDFRSDVYLNYMDFEDAKEWLKDGITEAEWNEAIEKDGHADRSEAAVVASMKDYMSFAIGKATDHRGLSANRSVQKMQAYGKVLGWYDDIDWDDYANYGAPILKAICDKYGWQELYESSYSKDEFLRMAEGKRCHDDCMEGCGYA